MNGPVLEWAFNEIVADKYIEQKILGARNPLSFCRLLWHLDFDKSPDRDHVLVSMRSLSMVSLKVLKGLWSTAMSLETRPI